MRSRESCPILETSGELFIMVLTRDNGKETCPFGLLFSAMAISYFQNELNSENAKPETLFIFAHLHPNSVLKFSKENCEIIPVI